MKTKKDKINFVIRVEVKSIVLVDLDKMSKRLLKLLTYDHWHQIFKSTNERKLKRRALRNMTRLADTADRWREIYWEVRKGTKTWKLAFRKMSELS